MKKLLILTALLTLVLTGCGPRSSRKVDDLLILTPKEKVANYERNVVWASPGGTDLHMDVSWPEGQGPFPILVWIHGGGWESYSKEANIGLARYITNRGYVVFNVDYRMSPEVVMKTIIEDAMGAVIWAKDHAAQYNGDPGRIAVAGHSAGGHLAAMVATAAGDPFFSPTYTSPTGHDCSVNAAIPVSGVFDFVARAKSDDDSWVHVFGASIADNPLLFEKGSPVSFVRKDLPPQLVVYAEEEYLREASEEWIYRLEQVGASHESYMQPGRKHLWPTWHWQDDAQQTYDMMVQFLDGQLK